MSANTYQPFTVKMAWDLAAPHTWPAAIMPALVSTAAASAVTPISVSLCLVMLLIVVLMQSAVNTFNDYYDYAKGTDDEHAAVDATDAVLVYNNVDPKSALRLAIGMLLAAFLLGIYPIIVAGFIPLVIALIGALFVVLYSAGKTPLSYLPLGEFVSGLVMGGLIPLAYYYVLTNELSWLMLLWSLPLMIGIALIMLTNNTSDIERDIEAGRRTLPVLLGRRRSVLLYRASLVLWLVVLVAVIGIWFMPGLIIMPFMLLAIYPLMKAAFSNSFTPEGRLRSMPQILSINIVLGAFYAAAMLSTSPLSLVL